MKIVWTQKADHSFNDIVDFLLNRWTVEEATNFIDEVEHTIELISENPEMFKLSTYDNQSREAFITKHTTMFYRILSDVVEIEYFWGNFKNPEEIQQLLKS